MLLDEILGLLDPVLGHLSDGALYAVSGLLACLGGLAWLVAPPEAPRPSGRSLEAVGYTVLSAALIGGLVLILLVAVTHSPTEALAAETTLADPPSAVPADPLDSAGRIAAPVPPAGPAKIPSSSPRHSGPPALEGEDTGAPGEDDPRAVDEVPEDTQPPALDRLLEVG